MRATKDQAACRSVFLRELKISRVYCVLKAYFDESYDTSCMCVGGWVCAEDTWKQIETKWLQRIDYERRMSVKRGHLPISRYHATYCSNLKDEFETWTIPRQIRLVKRLTEIIGTADPKPLGIFSGLVMKDLRAARPDFDDNLIRQVSYYLCMSECFNQIGIAMDEDFPRDQVTVIHEGAKGFNQWALAAYDGMKASGFPYADYFKGFTPGDWKDYPALQPADFLAFEGFKHVKLGKRKEEDLRRSLQAVIGYGVNIRAGFYKAHGMKLLTEGISTAGS